MLLCQFWFEVGIAHIGIVEVVESGIAVALFVESIKAEVNELSRAVGEEESWSEMTLSTSPFKGGELPPLKGGLGKVLYKSPQHACLHAQIILHVDSGGCAEPMCPTVRVEEHAELIVLHIICCTDVPPVEDAHFVRHGEVELLLQVLVLHADEFVVVVDIARIVVGVLHVRPNRPAVEQLILPSGLHERVAVPEAFAIAPHIIHNRTRHTALGVVVIELEFPEARIAIVVIDSRFHADGIDVAVLADGGGIVCYFARRCHTTVTERVLAIRVCSDSPSIFVMLVLDTSIQVKKKSIIV